MYIDRRQFVASLGLAFAGLKTRLPWHWNRRAEAGPGESVSASERPYGSGHFGEWMQDEFDLPAFRYTCDQTHDPKAVTAVSKVSPGILSATEHIHQVGNDRIIAVVSNYGHVRVRQDEGAPKFLNDYAPDRGYFGGGIGYLTDGKEMLCTAYSGGEANFQRIFGTGYFRKTVTGKRYAVDQVIFAPFGDDPVLISQINVTNRGGAEADLRWIEYWGCQPYEFSFRSFIEAFSGRGITQLRRDFANLFSHRFSQVDGGAGLIETKEFTGRPKEDEARWQGVLNYLKSHPNPFLSVPDQDPPRDASFDDTNPPATFLVSLDAPADGFATNGKEFFGTGGPHDPAGLRAALPTALDAKLDTTGPEGALLLERKFNLKPGQSRTLQFLYGYLPDGFDLKELINRYHDRAGEELRRSSSEWKKKGRRFSVAGEPWVERETTWNHYYLRSSLTYDTFFKEHIISQGSVYQYVMGFQGAARDPLQHALPFIFSDPDIVKEVIRYTLKEVRPDGSLPYGIVGHGMVMPTTSDSSSDMPMWLLWAASEYVLATRDLAFLNEQIRAFHVIGGIGHYLAVKDLLALCYRHLIEDVGTGQHGLMRMLHDDWNDALVQGWVPGKNLDECLEKGESVLNSAMAAYVFDRYALLIDYAGLDRKMAASIRTKAGEHRKGVAAQWTGKWFRRAWLGPTLGWLGEKSLWLEPQPWAIISGAADATQTNELIKTIDDQLRRPSPIGAMQLTGNGDMLDKPGFQSGTSITGGIWPSLNQTLIWALACNDGKMAWDEWKKNSFAAQKEVYPDIWYQAWSGTDTINSALSKHPGETTGSLGLFGWTDFPVFNLHSHACPLYSAAKLIGLDFTEDGFRLAPRLPAESYRFESPLFGLVKSPDGYEGWYEPSGGSLNCRIHLALPKEEAGRFHTAMVNGRKAAFHTSADGEIQLTGQAGGRQALRWSLKRA